MKDISHISISDSLIHDPFGMIAVGRCWESGSEYRYGFNSQEHDDEVYGNGNLNTAKFWEYDTRLGRRWNIDRIIRPGESYYAVFRNNPIANTDVNGNSPTLMAKLFALTHGIKKDDYRIEEGNDKSVWLIWGVPGGVAAKEFNRGGLDKVADAIKHKVVETVKSGSAYVLGVVNAWGSDNLIGAGRRDPSEFGKFEDWARAGQTSGDVLAVFTGSLEMYGGLLGVEAGIAVSATGEGALVGVPAIGLSTAVVVHGYSTTSLALHNLFIVETPDGKGGSKDTRTAQEIISQDKIGSINKEFPAQYYDKTISEIEKEAKSGNAEARKALKLLKDKRFNKPNK